MSFANLRTARLRSLRNPKARYTRLTVQPKVNTPSLFISYSLVIYLFLSYIVYLLGGSCKGKMSLVSGNLGIAPPYLVFPYRSRNNVCICMIKCRKDIFGYRKDIMP